MRTIRVRFFRKNAVFKFPVLGVLGKRGAMSVELDPVYGMEKWSGVLGLFRGLINVSAPIIGRVIWGELNPACVFLIPIAIDLVMRLPLLYTILDVKPPD